MTTTTSFGAFAARLPSRLRPATPLRRCYSKMDPAPGPSEPWPAPELIADFPRRDVSRSRGAKSDEHVPLTVRPGRCAALLADDPILVGTVAAVLTWILTIWPVAVWTASTPVRTSPSQVRAAAQPGHHGADPVLSRGLVSFRSVIAADERIGRS